MPVYAVPPSSTLPIVYVIWSIVRISALSAQCFAHLVCIAGDHELDRDILWLNSIQFHGCADRIEFDIFLLPISVCLLCYEKANPNGHPAHIEASRSKQTNIKKKNETNNGCGKATGQFGYKRHSWHESRLLHHHRWTSFLRLVVAVGRRNQIIVHSRYERAFKWIYTFFYQFALPLRTPRQPFSPLATF